jgi:hypothetical protein
MFEEFNMLDLRRGLSLDLQPDQQDGGAARIYD